MSEATDPVRLCLAGAISPEVALARLVLGGLGAAAIAARLDACPGAAGLRALLAARREGIDRLAAMLAACGLDHAAGATPAALGAMFDRAVAAAPASSVAAYALGDEATLGRATQEVVLWLEGTGLVGPAHDVLDLGCGIGRVAAALGERVRSVTGTDVSAGMVAEARRRHGARPGLRFVATDGRGIAAASASLDLVLAVDAFPYLVQAGVAEAHVADAARCLRTGGALVILNLSYRGEAADRADARRWTGHGFDLTVAGARPFALWDGVAWVLRR